MATKAQELADQISDFINGAREKDVDQLVKAMANDHRTLQQSTFKTFLKFMELLAKDDYGHDARNIDSHMMAKKLVDAYQQDQARKLKEWWPNKTDLEIKKMVHGMMPSGELPTI